MQHVQHLSEVKVQRPSIVTVGVFDGVHRGHQALIRQLVAAAHQQNQVAVVLTFFPHPDVMLREISAPYYLATAEQRAVLLGDLGVDVVVTLSFDEDLRQMRAADFVDQLFEFVNMSEIWATADFAMGYQREGNIGFLREQAASKDFVVRTIEPIADPDTGTMVSSTTIRELLRDGEMRRVAELLGRPYQVSGEVVKGEQRGRQIGFPTANVQYWPSQLLPAHGVYACRVLLNDTAYLAVTNIGNRPTFDGIGVTVEAHLLDFDQDIYGEVLQVDFLARLRGEKKFDGIDALISQIKQDVVDGREILEQIL